MPLTVHSQTDQLISRSTTPVTTLPFYTVRDQRIARDVTGIHSSQPGHSTTQVPLLLLHVISSDDVHDDSLLSSGPLVSAQPPLAGTSRSD